MSPQKNGSWTIEDVHDFGGESYDGIMGIDGYAPAATMILDAEGNLYGTTSGGGVNNPRDGGDGTVFEMKLQ